MEKAIFEIGDIITPIIEHQGYENAVVTEIKNGRYHLSIPCGTVIIPIKAQINYKLKTSR